MDWDRHTFAKWLKMKRIVDNDYTQQKLGDLINVTQGKISRWELADAHTPPPSMAECARLAKLFGVDAIKLAAAVGQWTEEVERGVLASLVSGGRSPDDQLEQAVALAELNEHMGG